VSPATLRAGVARPTTPAAAAGERTATRRAGALLAPRPPVRFGGPPPRGAPVAADARRRHTVADRAAAERPFPRALPGNGGPPPPRPPVREPATDTKPRTAATRAAAPQVQQAAVPQIDGPPPPSRRPGWDPAPVPHSNALPPMADRRGGGPDLSFGVPTPPQVIEGQTFRSNDSMPQARQQQQQGGGPRLPSPGATVRLPF
jgi:hypothetical protein